MYQLFIANKNYSSWSLRPWLLLTQLDIPFTEQLQQFAANNYHNFRSFSPTGKVPCLHDGDVVVWESLAIVEYLAERHPGVWPQDAVARNFARSACSEMHAGFGTLRSVCTMNCGVRVALQDPPAALAKELQRLDELWQQGLQQFGGPFLAGTDFSAVDAFFAPVAFRIQSYGLQLSAPAMAYVQQLLQLPAMQRWYEAALDESWREVSHEAEIGNYGRVVADYRRL
ncbi:glutathione S-transferase family protein [Rheinheimera riviphila]|uniref:Glutathione S-transferase family protein n=1 Tax=Rheinheimera riviphila TaxID=1834037 RepID=A0A437QFX3_9GAMM|nr:glutathione S-transferase family protein [Rheinheimera riviphila]RVU33346.1 glutathione S-transferase family protein [Rheinheimera riviphila]